MRTVISEATLEADFGGCGLREVEGGPQAWNQEVQGHRDPWGRGQPSGDMHIGSDGHQPPCSVLSLGLLVLPSPPHPQAPTGGPARSSVRFPHEHAEEQIQSQPRANALPSPFITGFREMH